VTDRRYVYSGPPSGVTLRGTPPREALLMPGREVVLPEESPYTRRLVAKGLLEPATERAAAARTSSETPAPRRPRRPKPTSDAPSEPAAAGEEG
jgi:hypothetical protein